MSNNLLHGSKANSVLHKFYRTNFVVYVEGRDDIPFWRHRIALTCEHSNFTVLSVKEASDKKASGKNEIKKLIEQITNENANFIVATDRDYSAYTGDLINASKVIYTYGYSIENTMFCPCVLNKMLQLRLRDYALDMTVEIKKWYTENINKLRSMIAIDILNQLQNKSISIFDKNLHPFMQNQNGDISLNEQLIRKKYDELKKNFDEKDIEEITKLLSKEPQNLYLIIRGHLLTGLVRKKMLRIIQKNNGNEELSNNAMYENTFDKCDFSCNCPSTQYLKTKIQQAIASL